MKKRMVGIYANYNASQQSFCAEFLAGYIAKCYRYAKWFVPDTPQVSSRFHGFSHQWDTEVVAWHNRNKETLKMVRECDTFFFFEPQEEILDSLPKHAVTAYFADPGHPAAQLHAFAGRCSFVLLPGETFRDRIPFSVARTNLLLCPFEPLLQAIPRRDLDFEKQPRLFFPAFGFSRQYRFFVSQVADIVKLCKSNVQTVVGFYDQRIAPQPGLDSRTYDWRLLKYLRHADWVIDLDPQPVLSLFPALAGGYGLQWIGLETPPNTEYHNAAFRHLIPTLADNGTDDALETIAKNLVRILDRPFEGHLDRYAGLGAWEHRRTECLRIINLILGIKTRY